MTGATEPSKPLDLPDWLSKPHRHPDYCDPCCDDSEAVIKWNLQHVGLLEKLAQDQADEIRRLRSELEARVPPPSPAPLEWTRDKPTREGLYWFRENPQAGGTVYPVRRMDSVGKLYVLTYGGSMILMEKTEPTDEWAGPIPEPTPSNIAAKGQP